MPIADILIVEDSPTQAERLRYLLETSGHQVRVAADGREALEALGERAAQLVITDVVMPGIDGYALCESIKGDEELREIPVILLTGLSEPQDVIRSLQCGADNFIRKPYDEKYLLSRISNILTSRELRESGRLHVGLEIYLAGEKHFISSERQQILDFLLSTYEEVAHMNDELAAKNAELEARQAELEQALRDLDTARERAEELANVKRAVLDATADGIVLVDVTGKPILRNAALERMATEFSGLGLDRMMFESADGVAELVADPEGYRGFVASLGANAEQEALHDLEVPDAGRHFRVFTAPVRNSADSLIGRIFVIRDVTAEREAERLKSDLVATVSHELRTPLASVLGFAELLLARELDETTRRRYVETIAGEARRLTDLTDDFLDLQRIEEGSFALTLEPLDLRDVVRQGVELFSGQSTAHTLALDLASDPVRVVGERDRLSQVLANLLSNAIKYSPEGGPVEVSTRERDGFAEVAVRDQGLGIPVHQQDKIFTKFFRADSSDTRRIGGTGLGLALCRQIVEAHDGEIGFESAAGEGSTFWFRLPATLADAPTRRD